MKKLISILLTAVLVLGSVVSVSAASTFVDVEDKFPWAVSAIEELVAKKSSAWEKTKCIFLVIR